VLATTAHPLVSGDIVGDPHSAHEGAAWNGAAPPPGTLGGIRERAWQERTSAVEGDFERVIGGTDKSRRINYLSLDERRVRQAGTSSSISTCRDTMHSGHSARALLPIVDSKRISTRQEHPVFSVMGVPPALPGGGHVERCRSARTSRLWSV
jgi:hypothetical protein